MSTKIVTYRQVDGGLVVTPASQQQVEDLRRMGRLQAVRRVRRVGV